MAGALHSSVMSRCDCASVRHTPSVPSPVNTDGEVSLTSASSSGPLAIERLTAGYSKRQSWPSSSQAESSCPPGTRPYALCRLSALPTEATEQLGSPILVAMYHDLCEVSQRIAADRDGISEVLSTAIGGQRDSECRHKLLALRRNLFNKRTSAESLISVAQAALSTHDAIRVSSYHALLVTEREKLAQFQQTYDEELHRARICLGEVAHDPHFRNGVLSSSPSLYDELSKVIKEPQSRAKRLTQMERGLLRYVTRASMKATPFSSFCTVIPAYHKQTLGEANSVQFSEEIVIVGNLSSRRLVARLNKKLFEALWPHLEGRRAIRRCLQIEVNPTLTWCGDKHRLLTGRGIKESFRLVSSNPAVDLIISLCKNAAPLRYEELASSISQRPEIACDEEQVCNYIDALLEHGVLRLRTGVPDQDIDWDIALVSLLSSIEDPDAHTAAATLGRLRTQLKQYQAEGVSRKATILSEMRRDVGSMVGAWNAQAEILSQPLVFDDMTAAAELHVPCDKSLQSAYDALREWIWLVLHLSHGRAELATMRAFFDAHYLSADHVRLLQYYEDFFRCVIKQPIAADAVQAHQENPRASEFPLENPLGLECIHRWNDARRVLVTLLRDKWRQSSGQVINLTRHELYGVVDTVDRLSPRQRSFAAFAHPLKPSQKDRTWQLLIKGATAVPGSGKYLSRFLHLLPQRFYDIVYDCNRDRSSEYLRVELSGDACFNANLHPPLLPSAISYPTMEPNAHPLQIPVTELVVSRTEDDPFGLCLLHERTGMRIDPCDLGFLSVVGRPPLFQLLNRFSSSQVVTMPLPESDAEGKALGAEQEPQPNAPRVQHRPRVTFNDALVLSRRRWLVPRQLLPPGIHSEPDCRYYKRLHEWRHENGIPIRVYVQLRRLLRKPTQPRVHIPNARDSADALGVGQISAEGDRSSTLVASSRAVRDEAIDASGARALSQLRDPLREAHKPQFMDFSSPLFVRLFAQMTLTSGEWFMIMEEVLPRTDQLPHTEAGHFSAELLIELDI